ncbi:MAG TPA: hypothetical protein VGR87_14715 [Candidatus Limnocylindria bacterium]|jgi:hypothetical protein|nr:hypothetical protein [Candidatus Limnocylindria bacterium]
MNDIEIERALGVNEPRVNTEEALARFRERVQEQRALPHAPIAHRRLSRRLLQSLAAAAGVVVVASALTLSGVADSIFTIFEPRRVVGVPVTQNDLNYLGTACAGLDLQQCLGAYGTFTWTTPPQPREVRSLSAAANAAGFSVQAPSSLPASISGPVRYGVINQSSATFTFSADSTRQAATRVGRTAPPLPANIDGSKLIVTGGPAVFQIWGAPASTQTRGDLSGLPTLVVGQAKAPVVTSDGVTVDQLRGYLLQQPGISPQLAAAIRAIGDPATTLPVPVPAELAISHPVRVQGVEGLFIGDNTGIASAVIWQKDGMMYEVVGSLTEAQALDIANSMR